MVLRFQDEFLLLKRNKFPYVGKYLPIGGKVEAFESPEDAARRETLEETGLKLDEIKYAGLLMETSPHPSYNWACLIFTAWLDDKIEPPYCDEGTLTWIPVSTLEEIEIPATDLPIYKCILNRDIFAFSATFDADLNMLEIHRLDQ